MKQYPKVPRWDHPVIPDGFYDHELIVTEKLDGSNFRFALYDDRFEYSAEVEQFDPVDGDIVFGTKTKVRGLARSDKEPLPANVRNAMDVLRDDIDRDALRDYHKEFGPLVLYAENMVRHTLDYGYDSNPPPALIGFDVYAPWNDTRDEIADHPYEETFEGFLDWDTAQQIFDSVGLNTVPTVHIGETHPTELSVPVSEYGAVQAEGVVFRAPEINRRSKLVRDEFRELNRQHFGGDFGSVIDDAFDELNDRDRIKASDVVRGTSDAGAAYIASRYVTSSRIRKHIQKLLDEGHDIGMQLMQELPDRVENDVWVEEIHEIKDLDIVVNPSLVSQHIADRCKNELQRIEQNMALSGADDPTELW